jgi:hypothetical protein
MAVHFGTTLAGGRGVMRQTDSGDVSLSTRQGKAKSKSPPLQNRHPGPPHPAAGCAGDSAFRPSGQG